MVWEGQEGVSATFWATLSVRRSNRLNGEIDDAKEQRKTGDAENDVGEELHGAEECGGVL
jgi:hypothetical protein